MQRSHRTKTSADTKGKVDRFILFSTIILTAFGILVVADASSPQAMAVFSDPYYFAKQQLMWASIGTVAMIATSFVDYRYWKKLTIPVLVVTISLLIAVILPGVGSRLLGARRWIVIGPFTLQPSELAKFAVALGVAYYIDMGKKWYSVTGLIGFISALIMLQPDLGTTIVVGALGIAQLFVSGLPILYMLGLGGAATGLGTLLVFSSEYRRDRLMTFLKSSTDPLGTSYHMRQILIALGSGGFFGAGIGQSRQKHLFLPETASDSIFAVIAEEIGFFGSAIIILILTIYVMRLFRVARRAPDKFSSLLATGIAAWIGSQMFLNLSSMVAITPLTGIPLPFFSYGGSSLVMILFGVGIILSISRYQKNEEK